MYLLQTNMYEFIHKYGINMEMKEVETNPELSDHLQPLCDHYEITLTRGIKKKSEKPFRFSQSKVTALWCVRKVQEPAPPSLADILAYLREDSLYLGGMSYPEWCKEWGYFEQAYRSRRTYQFIYDQADNLKQFLGEKAYNELLNLEMPYGGE